MAKGNFPTCLLLLTAPDREGGFAERKGDLGGPTFKGITFKMFIRWMQEKGSHACITLLGINDLKSLTDQQVAKFYYDEFWRPCRCEELPAGIDHACFDTAVMSGEGDMVKLLQGVVGVAMDGKLGPVTMAAVAAADAQNVVREIGSRRMAYYAKLPNAKDNPGWTTRVVKVTVEAMQMIDKAKLQRQSEANSGVAKSDQPTQDATDEKDQIQAQQGQDDENRPQENGQSLI